MVVDLLERVAADPDRTALVGQDRVWSYAQLRREVDRRAAALPDVGEGLTVPVVAESDAEGVIELLAHWRVGATPAPLNPGLTPSERELALGALEHVDGGHQAVLWTSGTGGRPRGVAISYKALEASAHAAAERLSLGPGDTWLLSLSPAHVGGLALLTRALLLGGRLVAVGPFDAERVDDYLPEITHLSVVPTQLARILDARGERPPPETFRCALVGGARAPADLIERALTAGWRLALTYGLSEATSQVATAPPELTLLKPGTVGAPLSGVEVRLGEGSEILVRGATLATCYVGPAGEALLDPEGWHHTGDHGRFDEDGDLWVTGRRADRIVTGGVTVDAVEVEEALRSHPDVADACVVGVPDHEWGERVAAWIESVGDAPDIGGLEAFLRGRLSGPKVPRVFHFGGPPPRNANGKLERSAIRELLS